MLCLRLSRPTALLAGLCALATAVSSCAILGGQTGDDATTTGVPPNPNCIFVTASLDEATDLGATPRQLLRQFAELPSSKANVSTACVSALTIAARPANVEVTLTLGDALSAEANRCSAVVMPCTGTLEVGQNIFALAEAKLSVTNTYTLLEGKLATPDGTSLSIRATASDNGWKGSVVDDETKDGCIDFTP